MRFFGYDGPLAEAARQLGRLMFLNICFMLCSLPVFTFGAAVTALYAAFLNENQSGGDAVNFFRAFAQNFRQATKLWLGVLAVGALLGVTAWLLLGFQVPGAGFLGILLLVLGLIYGSVCAFLFPLQAHYENTLAQTLRNAWFLGLGKLLSGILMTLISFLPAVLLLLDLRLFAIALFVWVFLGFAGAARINSWIAMRTFRKIEEAQG